MITQLSVSAYDNSIICIRLWFSKCIFLVAMWISGSFSIGRQKLRWNLFRHLAVSDKQTKMYAICSFSTNATTYLHYLIFFFRNVDHVEWNRMPFEFWYLEILRGVVNIALPIPRYQEPATNRVKDWFCNIFQRNNAYCLSILLTYCLKSKDCKTSCLFGFRGASTT